MPPSLQDQGVWLWHHRLYWWLSLVPLVWAPIAFGYGEETMQRATLAYWGAWLPAFLLRRRFPRLSLGAHLGVAVGTALYTLVLFPQGGLGALVGEGWRLPVAAFLAMGVYALGAYLGWVGGGLGLLMVLLAPWSDPKMRLLMEAGVLLAAAAGVSVHLTLNRLEALQALLGTLALNDPLTGLGNRRALELDYDRYRALAQREGNALWVSLWDLDGLKAVNDREGHAAGDRHLQAFARVLKEELREGDGVYRVGGDEFAALHLGLEGEALAERVRARFPAVSHHPSLACAKLGAPVKRAEADARMYRQKRLK